MRIKHTPYEYYALLFEIKCKDYDFWHLYKFYSTKQAAMKAMKRIIEKREIVGVERLRFKIVWSPSTWATEDKQIIVYTNENEVNENEK